MGDDKTKIIMKVLLINPPIENIIRLELPLWVRQNEGIFPPLGLMYIASYLNKSLNCEIKILDALAEKMNYEMMDACIREFLPDVVGITAHTHNLIDVIITAGIIKRIDKKIHVCLGGPHINIFPEESIAFPHVDSVVVGEGEVIFTELVRCLDQNIELKKVKGIFFKQNSQVINTGPGESINELDSLPFPDRSLLDLKRYYNILGPKSTLATMISSRGCPYSCAFCSTPKRSHRVRSPGNVVDEIEECVKLGIRQLYFVDDTFNIAPDRIIEICDELRNRKLKIKWSFRGRIDKLSRNLLIRVKESGCYKIHLGVETCTDDGLERLKKGITVEQIKQVFRWTRDIGINTVAYFMIGCPHEKSRKDILKTIDFSKEIDPDFALFNILMPYPFTEFYDSGLKSGMFKYDYWKEFASRPQRDFQPHFWEEWLSSGELVGLLNLAYRKFYLRPKFLFRMLTNPQNLSIFAKRLKMGLEIITSKT